MTPIPATVLDALADAWALLMPVDCAGCHAPDRGLCADCRTRLQPRVSWHRLPDGTPAASGLSYDGVARQVILAFKEHGRTDACSALAAPLAAAIEAAAIETAADATAHAVAGIRPELVTVPTSRNSYRRRGYDPVALLLRRAGYARSRVLRHSRGTVQQKQLDAESRTRNLAGSLRSAHPLTGRHFILVDDVLTTGATLGEAARAIRAAGGTVLSAATVAYTERLWPHFATTS